MLTCSRSAKDAQQQPCVNDEISSITSVEQRNSRNSACEAQSDEPVRKKDIVFHCIVP
ncbi:hypothetical protein DPMN_087287 [Dreissena polymorpha]|uniref:Uncharacterized protein n=1 Tax=Dreissena polymorpha TaxID=45954 RepID=A0A9D4KRY0_DREPO|nr:hypothetical protein DPMN_087287 [Dreissena polymorpha]